MVDVVQMLNRHRGGYVEAMGLTFVSGTADEVVARLEIGPAHLQPHGLVHGGVLAGMIETLASVGAAITTLPEGRHPVGMENATSFLRGVRSGTLTGRAVPLHRGRSSHVWEVTLRDGEDRLVATGRVRMMCVEAGSEIAGGRIEVPGLSG